MIIQDEYGASWEVAKGDPAWEYVSVLDRARFTKKALPLIAIRIGILPLLLRTSDDSGMPPYIGALATECVEYLWTRGFM